MSIMILITGGTFDKEYDELNGTLYFKETHLPEMLKLGRCTVPVEVKTAMMIDSLEMTDQQRKIIIEMCNRCEQNKIIITHGTDTMAVTAKVLGEAGLSKTIVLTGAMIPYKFGSSDGFFNLGSAFAFAQALPHGVYIAMNGRSFDWHNVLKNKKTGIFEEL
ncbi:MAG: asparaginase [Chitinophagaceae bacterium]|nr:asparaginase [Chitinophagaceae bacterium]